MTKILLGLALLLLGGGCVLADPSLTIYNQNFAVVRDTVPLDLKDGVNDVSFADTTAQLEPDSVILRDPTGKVDLQILEQNYRNDPVSQELLLSLFEGRTIDFVVKQDGQPDRTVQGKIVRSGYVLRLPNAGQPIIEVDGKLQFGLPGQPIFPTLGDNTILKPTLQWKLQVSGAAKLDAELAYITEGMSWHADYNVVEASDSNLIDIVGWITMDNQSGKTFSNAAIKLMAGDVNRVQNPSLYPQTAIATMSAVRLAAPAVTEKAFEDYHLYSLPRPTDLRDGETKQVEFIHASNVNSDRIYIFDGGDQSDTPDNTKVAIMREFKNSEKNHLGMALPKGRLRFYKKDDQALEFTGENTIDHTPQDETVRVYTGNAFDLVGERAQTNSQVNNDQHFADESYSIKLTNHKKEAAEIRVDEHLDRWNNWVISANTVPFTKTDAQRIEFRVPLSAGEEKTISYKVHYSW